MKLSVALNALLAAWVIVVPSSAAASSAERQTVPKVSKGQAVYYMRVALKREFSFEFGYSRNVKCTKRVTRSRVRCQRISWSIGDLGYKGRGTIWFTKESGVVYWNYSYRIIQTDYYCLNSDRPRHKCYKKFVAR